VVARSGEQQPTCPDPVAGRLTSLPKALWPLQSWHDELEHAGGTLAHEFAAGLGALHWYTDPKIPNYRRVNALLRERQSGARDTLLEDKVEALDALASAVPRAGAPGLILWRGLASFRLTLYIVHERAEKVTDPAYASCSVNRAVGNFYARRHALVPEDLEDSLLLRIFVPEGSKVLCAACQAPSLRVPGEDEVLLPRGSTLRIERVVPRDPRDQGAIHYAEARLISQAASDD